jgi:hypothetical protein
MTLSAQAIDCDCRIIKALAEPEAQDPQRQTDKLQPTVVFAVRVRMMEDNWLFGRQLKSNVRLRALSGVQVVVADDTS